MLNFLVFTFHGAINPPGGAEGPIGRIGASPQGLGNFIQTIISVLMIVAFLASFIMLLVAGIQWTTSGGDEKAVSAARGRATAAIIGLVLTLAAFAIIKLLETVLTINIISGGINLPGL